MLARHTIAASITLAFLLLLSTGSSKAAQQRPAASPAPAPPKSAATEAGAPARATAPAPEGIPVEEIAMQATQVGNLLRSFAADFAPSSEIEAIRKLIPQAKLEIALELKSTTNILKEPASLETLQSQEQIWKQKQAQLTQWLNVLTARATKLHLALTQLKTLQESWTKTRDVQESAKAPAPIVQQINTTLAAIQAAQQPHQAQRDEVLDLQGTVAGEVATCNAALAQIDALQQVAVGGIFTPESPPVWRADLWARGKATLPEALPKIAASYRQDILLYARDPSRHLPRHLAIFIALLLVLWSARQQVKRQDATAERPSHANVVFDHIFAGALLVTLMVAIAPASPVPIGMKQVFRITALVPIIVLTRPVVPPVIVPGIYLLAILFAADTVRQMLTALNLGQGLLILEAVVGLGVIGWVWLFGSRRAERHLGHVSMARRMVATFVSFSLCVGLVAAVFGYMRLARLAIPGVLAGAALALELYASVQVAMGVITYAFQVWPLRLLHMIEHHREMLERRAYLFLLWGVVVGWLSRYLDYLGLLDPAWSLLMDFLDTKLERGSLTTSVGDIFAFFLTVTGAYLLARFICFLLEEDVYPRTNIGRGQSYALSSLLNYTIIAVGFVVALAVLGMDLTRITVLAGAVGVGLGFGLQSVVNNFVSGLILLFERPIHVGDTVQVGQLQGRVRRIGIRASVVRTGQGAEIIVPNAQLITEQVTNWTLSDQLRRNDLPVGVNYGAEPKKVIELLEGVARAHPKVLQNPAPRCLFMSYGDSAINFELRAWTEYTDSGQVRSDLTVAIYDAVCAAGMSFPFPQREVRLVGDSDAPPGVSSGVVEKKT